MFPQEVRNTQFSQNIANVIMPNITVESVPFSDVAPREKSLISTIRALISHRMNDDDKIRIYGTTSRVIENDYYIYKYPVDAVIHHYTSFMNNECGTVTINSFDKDSDFNMNFVSEHFLEVYPDFVRVNKVTEFFKKSFKVICFIRPSLKQVALFLPRVGVPQIHFLQCAIPAMFPWYFPEDKGLSESEMKVLTSLRGNKYQDYIDAITAMSEIYDFRTEFIRNTLKDADTVFDRRRREELINNIGRIRDDISNYMSYISQCINNKNNLESELLGIETKLNSQDGDSELVEYFCCNKKLDLISLRCTTVEFVVRDYIEYYDEELAERIIMNTRSIAYMENGRVRNPNLKDGMKLLLEKIFIERKLKIKTCAAFDLDIGGGCDARSHYRFSDEIQNDYMPNPHIYYYSCMGTYSQIVANLMSERKYIESIEQCIASARSLNFGDSIVFSRFMQEMYSEENTTKCIELPDKTCLTVREAIQWIENNRE